MKQVSPEMVKKGRSLPKSPTHKLGKGASLPKVSLATFLSYLALFVAMVVVLVWGIFPAMAREAEISAQDQCAQHEYCAEYVELAGV